VTPPLAAGPGQPNIIARTSWATPACRPRHPAYYGEIDVAFVHHTDSASYYGPGQSAAMVRSICLFHRNVHGWNDLGYNFLVDRYGQIFEGRAGGIDEPLAGAQAGGYNLVSSGIAMLGTFSYSTPSARAMRSLSQLLAWKLSLHGIAAKGRTTVVVSPYGSVYSRYPAGSHVSLNRIAGHRDGDTTSCPGGALYSRLPRLRNAVDGMQGPISALSATPAAPTFSYPNPATVSGTLTSNGQPVPGAAIELQHRRSAEQTTVATATTAADGTWSAGAPFPHNATLRALYRGAPGISAIVSVTVDVAIAPQVTLSAQSQEATTGVPIVFSGTVAPAKPRVTFVISQLQPDAVTYAEVRRFAVAVNADGTFSRGVAFSGPGQYQVVAATETDDTNVNGLSAPVAMTVV
jgi:uncharacterized protein with LGFP repeats